jgi:NAD(P)H-nitrite reductase large subunit
MTVTEEENQTKMDVSCGVSVVRVHQVLSSRRDACLLFVLDDDYCERTTTSRNVLILIIQHHQLSIHPDIPKAEAPAKRAQRSKTTCMMEW